MVRLTRIPQHPRRAREQHEQIQLPVQRRPVQPPRPQYLRPQHLLETSPVLVLYRRVRHHSHAVDHPAQRRQLRINPVEQVSNRSLVRHVRELHPNFHSPLLERLHHRRRARVRRPTTVQHDRPRATLRQPARHLQADPAQTSRHQVTPIPAQTPRRQRRRTQDQLPHMTRLPQVLESADPASSSGQRVHGSGRNSPEPTRSITPRSTRPTRSGSSTPSRSAASTQYRTSGRAADISSAPQIPRFPISTKLPPSDRHESPASMNPSPVRLFSTIPTPAPPVASSESPPRNSCPGC